MSVFRLVTVERLRAQQLESRGRELRAAVSTLETAIAQHSRLTSELTETGGPTRTSGANLQVAGAHRERLRDRLQVVSGEIAQLQQRLGETRAAWLGARAQFRAVAALHERYRVARRAELARRDQRELDELAGTRRQLAGATAESADKSREMTS
jgi:flagellar export protein FliJ